MCSHYLGVIFSTSEFIIPIGFRKNGLTFAEPAELKINRYSP